MRQRTDALERGVARGFNDGVAEPIEIGNLEFVHHLDKASAAFVIACGAGIDVALDLERLADIGAHQAQQVLAHAPFAREWHDWNRQTFLEHLAAIRSHAEPADIDDMNGVGE